MDSDYYNYVTELPWGNAVYVLVSMPSGRRSKFGQVTEIPGYKKSLGKCICVSHLKCLERIVPCSRSLHTALRCHRYRRRHVCACPTTRKTEDPCSPFIGIAKTLEVIVQLNSTQR